MSTTYTPAATAALFNAFTGNPWDDPITYASHNNKFARAFSFYYPITNEVLKLIQLALTGGTALNVYNSSGGSLPAGPITITGYNVANSAFTIGLASATGVAPAFMFLTAGLGNNQSGVAYIGGNFVGLIDTSGSVVGNPVYLSTAGIFTLTAPSGADQIVQEIGRVVTLDPTSGVIQGLIRAPKKVGTSFLQAQSITTALIAANAVNLTTQVSNTLPIANGGTASNAALTASAVAVSNGTALVQGPVGTTTTVLHGNAAGTPTYGAVVLTTDVSGVAPIANGGTNQNSLTNHALLVGAGASTGITQIAVPVAGKILTSVASADPAWSNTPTLGIAGTSSGTIALANVTAGTSTIQPPASVSPTLTLPTTTGNLVGTGDTGTVTNTMLAGGIDLTTKVGTSVLPVANGGTGNNTLTNHGVLVGAGTSVVSQTAVGAAHTVLHGNGSTLDPTFGSVDLANDVSTSVLPPANGGTGRATLTNHGVLVGAGTANITQLAVPVAGQILTSVASADPAWSNTPTLGIAGTTSGQLNLASATGGTPFIVPGATAGSPQLTLPVSTGILVGSGDTGTVTNTMIAASTIDVGAKCFGTTAAGNATAGNVGEAMRASCTSTQFTAASSTFQLATGCTLPLTAGDWDVSAMVKINPNGATTLTEVACSILVNNSTPGDGTGGDNEVDIAGNTTVPMCMSICSYRVNINSSQTAYLNVFFIGTGTKPNYLARISARRVR